MAFVVDFGGFETRCGYSDEFSPCYIHRSVARQMGSQFLFGEDAMTEMSHLRPSSTSSFSSQFHSRLWPANAVLQENMAQGLLNHHLRHMYNELTQSAAPIAFARNTSTGRLIDVPALPWHFVVPEYFFTSSPKRHDLFKFTSIVLESGECPAFYASRPSVTAALGSGKASALVLDIGHTQSTVAAVVDGAVVDSSVRSSGTAGASVNTSLLNICNSAGLAPERLLFDCRGVPLSAIDADAHLTDLCHRIKVRGGLYLGCPHIESPQGAHSDNSMYTTPDGEVVALPHEARTLSFECLFSDTQAQGSVNIAYLLKDSKATLPSELQSSLPLVIAGGTSVVAGFQERLHYEIKRFDLSATDVALSKFTSPILAPHHSLSHLQWSGAALVTNSSAFAGLWITREEFAEEGEGVIRRKLIQ